jgi:type I restriction enzyme R subunit
MLSYIVDDFLKSRVRFDDDTIGGIVVCDSSDQAKKLFEFFTSEKADNGLSAALILHDIGTKDERKKEIEDFKEGKIDLLFVYNMLLTGFDAKRLKKLYIGRLIKDHNLLQTLTRVNRPYKNFRYGFVVDFADIRKEFDATNKAYFDELQLELGDEMQNYSNLFKSKEEIEGEIDNIYEKLFHYDLDNAEIFSQQISQIQDTKQVLEIKKALENAKNIFNLIRLYDHQELLEKLDFKKLTQLYNETAHHLELLNLKNSIQNNVDTTNLLNVALENVVFMFRKTSEEELLIADQLKETLRKTRESLNNNFDKKDPEFISLYDELKRIFNKKNLDEITQDEMKQNIDALQHIHNKCMELNRKNNLLMAKYHNDVKYARMHKRILEAWDIGTRESQICDVMLGIKAQADNKLLINTKLLDNEPYFEREMMRVVIDGFEKTKIQLELDTAKSINACLVKEYINEYKGLHA